MRKILKPKNIFSTKNHRTYLTLLADLQDEIFSSSKIVKEQRLAEILSAEIRFQILYLLGRRSSLCVTDISDVLRVSVSAVSHQLKWLREENLVIWKKKGRVVYYSLSSELPKLVETVLVEAES